MPIYDDIMQAESAPALGADPRFKGTLELYGDANPDEAAKQRAVARQLNVPPAVVETLPAESARAARFQQIDKDTATAPTLRSKFTDADFTKLANDDTFALSAIEKGVRALTATARYVASADDKGGFLRDLGAGVLQASAGVNGMLQAGTELLAPLLDPLAGTVLPENPLRRVAAGFAGMGARNRADAKAIAPPTDSLVGNAVSSGVQSLSNNLLTLPLALLPGGQGPVLANMAANQAGQSYAEARAQGVEPVPAMVLGASQGAIEYATEKLPLGVLLKDIGANAGFLRMLGRQVATEVPGEQVATILQDLNEWAALPANKDKPFMSYLEERPSAAASTLISTIIGVGGQTTIMRAVAPVMNDQIRQMEIQQNEQDVQKLTALFAAATDNKLRERSPETFQDLVQSIADSEDSTAPSHVFIDGTALVDTLKQSGITDEQLTELLPSVPAQLAEAVNTGGTVEIPLGELMARVAGTGLEQQLLQHVRMTPDGLSQVEAKEAAAEAANMLAQDAQRVIQEAQQGEIVRTSAQVVHDNILGQLEQAGRFTSDVNGAYAALVRDFYTATSSRLGVTPEQLYAQYPLRIGATAPAGVGLDQAQPTGTARREAAAANGVQIVETSDGFDAMKDGVRVGRLRDNLPRGAAAQLGENANIDIVKVDAGLQGQGVGAALYEAFHEKHGGRVLPSGKTTAQAWQVWQRNFPEKVTQFVQAEAARIADGADPQTVIGNITDPNVAQAVVDAAAAMPVSEQKLIRAVLEQSGRKSGDTVYARTAERLLAAMSSFPANSSVGIMLNRAPVPDLQTLEQYGAHFTRENAGATREQIVEALYAETLAALTDHGNAVGWYDAKTKAALALMAEVHPEIATDPRSKFTFTAILAVTSNGLFTRDQFVITEQLYRKVFKETGRFPESVPMGGTRRGAMERTFAQLNGLVDQHGWEAVKDFMGGTHTAAEVKAWTGSDNTFGEQVDSIVPGAVFLGPKLGAYFTNLNGDFSPITMDRWFMRTINRVRGQMMSLPGGFDNNLFDVYGQVLAGADTFGVDRAAILADIKAFSRLKPAQQADIFMARESMPNLREYARLRFLDYSRQKLQPDGSYKSFAERTPENNTAKAINQALTALNDAPFRASDRTEIRGIFADVQQMLKNNGIELTNADLQAVLWYYEKDLLAKVKSAKTTQDLVEESVEKEAEDYETAARYAVERLRKQGLAPASTGGVRSGGVQPGDAAGGAAPVGSFAQSARQPLGRDSRQLAGTGQAGLNDESMPTVGIHFSRQSRTTLTGDAYGTGLKGLEADRLAQATDPRLKSRIYLYIDEGKGVRPEAGVGGQAHSVPLPPLYDAKEDPLRLWKSSDLNGTESAILDAGFGGYYVRNLANQQGFAVVIGPASRGMKATPIPNPTTKAPPLPVARLPYKRGLLSAELASINIDDIRAVAPSARVDMGNFIVNSDELPMARAAASAQGINLPDQVLNQTVQAPALVGLPTNVTVDGQKLEIGPFEPARQAAANYMASAGLPYAPPTSYAKVDQARAKRIAAAYEAMPHAPNDPEVKAAYDAMIAETLAQYEAILATGLQVEFITGADPYAASPRLATEDVRQNNHMFVYSTRDGFGSSELDVSDNPLLAETQFEISGQVALANDIFRVVHDYFGHVKEGVGFRADGEENAWRSHAAMYSPLARRAMTSETRGQNSWVNFGPHGEKNRTASAAETVFADQKTGLLPEWVSEEGTGNTTPLANTKVTNADGTPRVVYHGSPVRDFTEFDLSKINAEDPDAPYNGFWFSTNEGDAENAGRFPWGRPNALDSQTRAFYLNLKNPASAEEARKVAREISRDFQTQWPEARSLQDATRMELQKRGFDGVEHSSPLVIAPAVRAAVDAANGDPVKVGKNNYAVSREADGTYDLWQDGGHVTGGFESLDAAVEDISSGVYVAFKPNQIKSATGNNGNFDPASDSILEQEARGTFNPATLQISLLERADLSTFLHELGHFFLEVQADLASQPGAPAQVVDDMGILLKWFGVSDLATWRGMTLDQQRKGHEQFAESFEQYLFEGKAPSRELQSLFGRFRAWMINVYRSLQQFMAEHNTQLSDDVRGVMDRMLADAEQIREAQTDQAYRPSFESLADSGMTQEEWEAYQATGEQATTDALDALQKRSLRDMQWLANARGRVLRELQAEAREKRKAVEEEVRAEVMATPVEQVRTFMREQAQQTPEGKEALKEWRERADAAKERFTEEGKAAAGAAADALGLVGLKKAQHVSKAKRSIANTVERQMIEWEGANPKPARLYNPVELDLVAERFGFTSGDELRRALADAEPAGPYIEALTDQRMLERYGDIATPAAQARAANEAVHNEARAKFIATELAAMQNALNATEDTGRVSKGAKPRRITVNALTDAARQFATRLIAARKVRDIKPAQHAAAERRAGQRLEKAMASGDTKAAITAKRDQLLNNFATKLSYDAQAEVDRMVRYLTKVADTDTLPADYKDQIDKLLDRYDIRRSTSLTEIDRRASLLDWVESQRELGIEPAIPAEVLNEAQRISYKELTMEEFRGLVDSIKQIEHLGRLKNKLLTAKDKRDFEAVRDTIVQSLVDNGRGRTADTRTPTTTLGEVALGLKRFWASHIKAATWARVMDGGKDGGPMWDYIIRAANAAGDQETSAVEKATKDLAALIRPVLAQGKLGGKGVFFPGVGRSFNRESILTMALNTGNDSNLQRLLGGEGWTAEQLRPMLDTLSAADWKFVQGVWDYFESFRPAIAAKEMRVNGVQPEWIPAVSREEQGVLLRGGYYPVKYDTRASERAEAHSDAEAARAQMKGAYTSATTRRSFTKTRADEVVGRPLLYSLDGLYSGVQEVIHDLSWHEFLIDANRLIKDKAISATMRGTYGPEAHQQFKTWLQDTAQGYAQANTNAEAFASYVRRGVSVSGLGFNLMSALIQPVGLTQTVTRIGARYTAKGVAEYIANPLELTDRIHDMSDFMRTRAMTRLREIAEVRSQVKGQSKTRQAIDSSAYFLMMRAQQLVDIPTWWGAYEKAIGEGNADDRAVALADQAVIDSQGSGGIKDQAAIERGGPAMKLFTVFYSFFNTTLNNAVAKTMTSESKAKLAADYALLFVVPTILTALLKAALTPGDSGDWDDPAKAAKKLAGEQISFLFGLMVGVREVGGAVQVATGTNSYGTDYAGPAGLRPIADAYKLGKQVNQGEMDDGLRKSLINTAGTLLRLPSAQINRSITGAKALADGKTQNPAALILGYEEPKH